MSGTGRTSPLRWAEIIAVGSELLVPPRLDTNSLFITEKLNDCGIEVRAKAIVGDRREDLESVLRAALSRTELVVLCGGLGPTDDDLTREAVAAVTGREMHQDASVLDGIRQRFAARGARMPDINRQQARVPAGAEVTPTRTTRLRGWVGTRWLWNDPFSFLLSNNRMVPRLPALPEAAWFFHASPENHLSFRDDLPANGFLAATLSS